MANAKDLECGCCIYVNGAGMAKRRCMRGRILDKELREAFEASAWLDGSRPAAKQRVLDADRALVEHGHEGQ